MSLFPRFLDRILAYTLHNYGVDDRRRPLHCRPGLGDPFTESDSYPGWLPPVKHLLAWHYAKRKQALLTAMQMEDDRLCLSITDHAFSRRMLAHLHAPAKPTPPLAAFFLRPLGFFTLLAVTVLAALLWLDERRTRERIESHFEYGLAAYAEMLHRKTDLLNRPASDPGRNLRLATLEDQILHQRGRIIDDMPQAHQLRASMGWALHRLDDPAASPMDVVQAFGQVNQGLRANGLPYYLYPDVIVLPCAMMDTENLQQAKQVSRLDKETFSTSCRSFLMFSFRVQEVLDIQNDAGADIPIFVVRKLDHSPFSYANKLAGLATEGSLGAMVFIDTLSDPMFEIFASAMINDQHLQKLLKAPSLVTAALDDERLAILREKLSPLELTMLSRILNFRAKQMIAEQEAGVYAVPASVKDAAESFDPNARALEEDLTLLQGKIRFLFFTEPTTLSHRLVQPATRLATRYVAFHEAYHRLDKPSEPAWLAPLLRRNASSSFRRHVAEETGAYLVSLAYGGEMVRYELSTLGRRMLDPELLFTPESYAYNIILNALSDQRQHGCLTPRLSGDGAEVLWHVQTLNELPDQELSALARAVFAKLFDKPMPVMSLRQ